MQHIINGNGRQRGLKAGMWNCNRGLVDNMGRHTANIAEIENFINMNEVHIMGLVELGLHGRKSNTIRTTPMTTEQIRTELAISGYKLILPDS